MTRARLKKQKTLRKMIIQKHGPQGAVGGGGVRGNMKQLLSPRGASDISIFL